MSTKGWTHLRVEDLMSRSFLETARASVIPTATRNIQRINKRLETEIPSKINCLIGEPDIEDFYANERFGTKKCSQLWTHASLIKEHLKVGTFVTARIFDDMPLWNCVISAVNGSKCVVVGRVPQGTPAPITDGPLDGVIRHEIETTKIFSIHGMIFHLVQDVPIVLVTRSHRYL